MTIRYLCVTIEPDLYQSVYRKITVKIERIPGDDLMYQQVVPESELLSFWDYLWQRMGVELKNQMLAEEKQET